MATFPSSEPEPKGKSVRIKLPIEASLPWSDVDRLREKEEEGALTGCREAVEILTRNPKKRECSIASDKG
jgi:hypothetical protein